MLGADEGSQTHLPSHSAGGGFPVKQHRFDTKLGTKTSWSAY